VLDFYPITMLLTMLEFKMCALKLYSLNDEILFMQEIYQKEISGFPHERDCLCQRFTLQRDFSLGLPLMGILYGWYVFICDEIFSVCYRFMIVPHKASVFSVCCLSCQDSLFVLEVYLKRLIQLRDGTVSMRYMKGNFCKFLPSSSMCNFSLKLGLLFLLFCEKTSEGE
jgi:hypothetical protein